MCTRYEGFGSLQTPEDLLGKLQRDYEILLSDPNKVDSNFNFFVTALHLLDWKYPDTELGNRERRRELTNSEILLQICSHIANGAKHFTALNSNHESVTQINTGGLLLANPQTETGLRLDDPRTGLIIELDEEAKEIYGERIQSKVLARHILDFWTVYLEANRSE